ncbi:29140_t:CDS:2 [Gigaspora margarita]|uniref:29140_t:CDS:1 n=1 Tax=Gigaspora margarita TaxID=4874 RepID=A0ABN7VBB2_GIGMA|nr:29140_t:CDS:2 [Gigaspora margarita]
MSQQVILAASENNSLDQIMILLQKVVSVVKNNNYTRFCLSIEETDKKEAGNNRNLVEPREEKVKEKINQKMGNSELTHKQEKKKGKTNNKKKLVRKKPTKLAEPLIITKIQLYSIMTDLQNKKADITYAQLFQAALNIRKEVLKILRLRRTAHT